MTAQLVLFHIMFGECITLKYKFKLCLNAKSLANKPSKKRDWSKCTGGRVGWSVSKCDG